MTAMELPKHEQEAAWGPRLWAGLGFLLALVVAGLCVSRQVAMYQAQTYLQHRYKVNVEVPVLDVSPAFLAGPTKTGRPVPPLGFCWSVELDIGASAAEVLINPWTHEIVDWQASL